MFAGHSMLCPYDGKESPRREYMLREKRRTGRRFALSFVTASKMPL
jgi:hypothetical protein